MFQIKEKVDEFGHPLTNWYKKNITDLANDNYYDPEAHNAIKCATDDELEAYAEYVENGGEMTFEEWQKYMKDWED